MTPRKSSPGEFRGPTWMFRACEAGAPFSKTAYGARTRHSCPFLSKGRCQLNAGQGVPPAWAIDEVAGMPRRHGYGLRRQAKRDAALAKGGSAGGIRGFLLSGKAASPFACRRSPKRLCHQPCTVCPPDPIPSCPLRAFPSSLLTPFPLPPGSRVLNADTGCAVGI